MTVNEYRKQNPKCKYCEYSREEIFGLYCKAKATFPKPWAAKKCPLYEPEAYLPIIQRPKPPNLDSGVVFVKK